MADIKQVSGNTLVDYTARDYDSLLDSMRALIPGKLPEWTDFASEADFGNVVLELFAHMGDILSYYQDRIANESFLGTAQSRNSIIQHLRLIGYRLSTAAPAAASLRLAVPASCNSIITISKGTAFATKSQQDRPSLRFEYTRELPLTIDCGTLPLDPGNPNQKVYAAGIPVEEGLLVADEILGISNGTPNQRFMLSRPGVILRSLNAAPLVNRDLLLFSEQDTVVEAWSLKETLAFSRQNQMDFEVDIDDQDRATVMFGDGAFGFIPPAGRTIRVSYRVGGGAQGNVGANTIQTLADAPQLALIGAQVSNPLPATGGADRESIPQAVANAPGVFRSLRRAVTADDYKALALNFNGVGKVRAEPGGWNTVNLYVAPEGGGQVSDVLGANLLAYFEDKRPVTTLIEIKDVDYVSVYVTAEIGVKGYYVPEEVVAQLRTNAGALLAFDNVDFSAVLYLSKFYEAIESINGIQFVTITEFRRAGGSPGVEPSGRLALSANELPTVPDDPAYLGGVRVVLAQGLN